MHSVSQEERNVPHLLALFNPGSMIIAAAENEAYLSLLAMTSVTEVIFQCVSGGGHEICVG